VSSLHEIIHSRTIKAGHVNGPDNPGLLYKLNFSEKEKSIVGTAMLRFHAQTKGKGSSTLTQTRHVINLGWNCPRQVILKKPQCTCRNGSNKIVSVVSLPMVSVASKTLTQDGQFPNLGRNGSCQVIEIQSNLFCRIGMERGHECELEPIKFQCVITWQPATLTQGSQ
jgi:hypothetical protein